MLVMGVCEVLIFANLGLRDWTRLTSHASSCRGANRDATRLIIFIFPKIISRFIICIPTEDSASFPPRV